MPQTARFRARPVIDRLLLIFVIACFGIAVVRVMTVAAAVTRAVYTQRQVSDSRLAGVPTTVTVMGQLRSSSAVVSWWGIRPAPFRLGGSYLAAVSAHTPARTLGSVIGVIAEQDRAKGVRFERVIVPTDRTRLYGQPPGLLVVSADGSSDRTGWRPLASDAAAFTDVPVVKQKYDPVLTDAQYAAVKTKSRLRKRADSVFVGKPVEGGSGVWVLLAHPSGADRQYLLVPLEASPLGGAL